MFPSTQLFVAQPTQTATTAFTSAQFSAHQPMQYPMEQPMQYVVEQPAQYVPQQASQFMSQQPMQYVCEQPGAYAVQQPMQQYAFEQPGQYLAHEVPQVMHYEIDDHVAPQYFTMPDGRLVEIDQHYAANEGQLVQQQAYELAAPMRPAAQPEVYNVSPEQFAFVARGGSIPEAQLRMLPRAAASAAQFSFVPTAGSGSSLQPMQLPGAEWARSVSQAATATPTNGHPLMYR